jgi:hypothetical protein
LFSIHAFLRSNTILHQLQIEIDVTYEAVHRCVKRFMKTLNAPSLDLVAPVEIDELYVTADPKVRCARVPVSTEWLSGRYRSTSYHSDPKYTNVGRNGMTDVAQIDSDLFLSIIDTLKTGVTDLEVICCKVISELDE